MHYGMGIIPRKSKSIIKRVHFMIFQQPCLTSTEHKNWIQDRVKLFWLCFEARWRVRGRFTFLRPWPVLPLLCPPLGQYNHVLYPVPCTLCHVPCKTLPAPHWANTTPHWHPTPPIWRRLWMEVSSWIKIMFQSPWFSLHWLPGHVFSRNVGEVKINKILPQEMNKKRFWLHS